MTIKTHLRHDLLCNEQKWQVQHDHEIIKIEENESQIELCSYDLTLWLRQECFSNKFNKKIREWNAKTLICLCDFYSIISIYQKNLDKRCNYFRREFRRRREEDVFEIQKIRKRFLFEERQNSDSSKKERRSCHQIEKW